MNHDPCMVCECNKCAELITDNDCSSIEDEYPQCAECTTREG